MTRREYWRVLLGECGRSRLSQAEFCRRRGIPPGTLSCWKHKLAREAPPARPSFVPIRIAGPRPPRGEPMTGVATDGAGEVEIALVSGRLVRVRGRVDAQWLGQVIGMLEAPRC